MKNTRNKYMTRRQRKALLALHGITMTAVAKATGRTCKTVSTVVSHYPKKKSRPIQEYIAAHTGKTFEQIWGNIPDGRTVRHKTINKHTPTIADKKQAVND